MTRETKVEPGPCRVLLLGASGRVGRMVRAVWAARPPQDVEVTPVFRSMDGATDGVAWRPGNAETVLPQVDAIVALWGIKAGSRAALAENSGLAVAAMELGQRLGARRVLHASSMAVYRPGPAPLSEGAACAPATEYGASKLAMERAVAQWQAANPGGPQAVMLRIGNVAGADSLFLNLRPGGRIRLDRFTDGSGPRRSYIAPDELADALTALCRADLTGAVNVSAPTPTGMDAITLAGGAVIDWVPAPDTALPIVCMDTTRLQPVCPMRPDAAKAAHLVASAQATGVWP